MVPGVLGSPVTQTNEACPICGTNGCVRVLEDIRDWEYGVNGSFSHCRCRSCGAVHLRPFPDLATLRDAYDVPYHGYAEPESKGGIYNVLFRLNEWRLLRGLRRVVRPGARVLDVGCGSGRLLETLKNLGPSTLQGIDFSGVAVDLARARGVEATQGLFLDLTNEESRYDVIFMNNYIEHTLDPASELALAGKLLAPGGRLIGELPSYRSLDRVLFRRYWGGNHVPRHTFQFTPQSIQSLLRNSGFDQIEIKQELNSGHWALSVQNYLRRNRGSVQDGASMRSGRAKYFPALLLLFLPINALMALLGLSSVIRFNARAEDVG